MNRLVLASRNRGKLADFSLLLSSLQVELASVADFTDEEVEETGASFVENALLKARHASQVSGLPALADDSGLVVDALGGAPGIYSARYAGRGATDEANNLKLLADMAELTGGQRAAHFHCTLVVVQSAADPAPIIADGRWEGVIANQASGDGGFGYDPLFIPAGGSASVAELSAQKKNQRSHRGLAMQQLLPQLMRLVAANSG